MFKEFFTPSRPLLPQTDLYAITASAFSLGRSNLEVVKAMLEAKIKIIQYREKDLSMLAKYRECIAIRDLTVNYGAILIINDDLHLAQAVAADGVHLGQEDMHSPFTVTPGTQRVDEIQALIEGMLDPCSISILEPGYAAVRILRLGEDDIRYAIAGDIDLRRHAHLPKAGGERLLRPSGSKHSGCRGMVAVRTGHDLGGTISVKVSDGRAVAGSAGLHYRL
ncbi:MAG: thiamine phosphate synthase [Anaerolineae bacterium]|nr:thiamine phosphate synthase [Anaerolineae bacterium]